MAKSETYTLPLATAEGTEALQVAERSRRLIIAEVRVPDPGQDGIIYDGIGSPAWCSAQLALVWQRKRR